MSDLGDAVGDNANGQDREQGGHGPAAVSRRSFVVGVAAAGAAATAAQDLAWPAGGVGGAGCWGWPCCCLDVRFVEPADGAGLGW